MRRALIKAGKGVLVEHEQARDPPRLVLLRGHLSQQVVHQLDAALLLGLVLLNSQVDLRLQLLLLKIVVPEDYRIARPKPFMF